MTENLGKIEKPEASSFKDKKKLYLVSLLLSWQDAPQEYAEMHDRYWHQVAEHLASLEARMGKISHLYHESITQPDAEGMKTLARLSPPSFKIFSEKRDCGATFETVENEETLMECMDWERMLMAGFISQKVADAVSNSYTTANRNRYQHITDQISKTLKEGESAVLFIRQDNLCQFPEDVEVFSVAPPSLDEIQRWLRERPAREAKRAEEEKAKKAEAEEKPAKAVKKPKSKGKKKA